MPRGKPKQEGDDSDAPKRALSIPVPGPGRDTLYRVEYNDQVRKLCLLGATDKEIADFFGVTTTTIDNWKRKHPAFIASIREGKVQADANVADSLYRRATGESVLIEKVMKNKDGDFEAIKVTQYIPGDPQAAYRWLLNRRREQWSEKDGNVNVGLTVNVNKEDADL